MKPSPPSPVAPVEPPPPEVAEARVRRHLFGVDFDALTQAALVDRIEELVSRGPGHWIATINVNLLCLGRRDRDYHATLTSADVITADGMPIVWMSTGMDPRSTTAVRTEKFCRKLGFTRMPVTGGESSS